MYSTHKVPDALLLDHAIDRMGRLGLGRRPDITADSLNQANSVYSATMAKAPANHGGRRGLTALLWLMKHYLASRDIRVNLSNDPVAGGCTLAEPVKELHRQHRTCLSSNRLKSLDIGTRRADCGSAVAVICGETIFLPFLPELYMDPDRTSMWDDNVTSGFCCGTNGGRLPAAVLNTIDTLTHSPVGNCPRNSQSQTGHSPLSNVAEPASHTACYSCPVHCASPTTHYAHICAPLRMPVPRALERPPEHKSRLGAAPRAQIAPPPHVPRAGCVCQACFYPCQRLFPHN
jgi:hypothetical protein